MKEQKQRGGLRSPKGGRRPKLEAKYRHRMISLPPALDDRLIKWSIETGREISPMIAELVDNFLTSQAP